MPAMALFYGEDYAFNERFTAFYRERARGGVGLMIMGPMAIDRVGSNPFMPGLFEDRQIGPIREFVREIHEETEARIGIQLMHLGRYASSTVTAMQPIAPTALASPLNNEVPREMNEDDIETVQDAFVKAALRARDAGCDFVELMAAGGHLIGEFLSPATNRRIDKYGGSSRNRMRFGLEIIEKVRQALGDGLALGIRVSGRDFITMGRTGAESARFCVEAERRGVNCINVTGGWHETNIPQITSDVPPGAYVYLARGVKEKVEVPVFASNRLGDPEIAEEVLRSGAADAICWGRPLIADPDLPRKVKEGRFPERVPCIGCNQGCLDSIFSNLAVSCTVNPRAGRESETRVEEAPAKKRVFVAGGGPAGLQFALAARQRGHEVVLYEKAERLGGQVNLIAVVPGKEEFLGAVESLERRVRAAGADLRLRTELTCETVRKEHPDLLVVATGARQTDLDIPGIDGPAVVNAWDVLSSSVPRIGTRIAIIGGGAMGCETALYLAHLAVPSAKTIAFLAFHEADSLSSIKRAHVQQLPEDNHHRNRKESGGQRGCKRQVEPAEEPQTHGSRVEARRSGPPYRRARGTD